MYLERDKFPLTVEQYAEAADVCQMRVYRMIKSGQLRTNAARPMMITGLRKEGPVPRRIWRHRIEEAAARAKFKPHLYGFRPGGAFHILVHGQDELVIEVIEQGATVGALDVALKRIQDLANLNATAAVKRKAALKRKREK